MKVTQNSLHVEDYLWMYTPFYSKYYSKSLPMAIISHFQSTSLTVTPRMNGNSYRSHKTSFMFIFYATCSQKATLMKLQKRKGDAINFQQKKKHYYPF